MKRVYDPAEDTFLFLDALEQDAELLAGLAPSVVVDIGCGSGCIGTFILQLLGHQQKAQRQLKQGDVQTVASSSGPPLLLSVDINPVACAAASVTNRVNGTACHADSVAASLASAFRKRIADLVTFNPPYVVSRAEDVRWNHGDITAAWAGGQCGVEVIHQFIDQLPDLVSSHGAVYLLAEEVNNIPDIQRRLSAQGFDSVVTLSRKRRNERLAILRCTRQNISQVVPS